MFEHAAQLTSPEAKSAYIAEYAGFSETDYTATPLFIHFLVSKLSFWSKHSEI
jgi:hypothetical protein